MKAAADIRSMPVVKVGGPGVVQVVLLGSKKGSRHLCFRQN